jgi:protein involved in polysaccharide export with SLBB domain
MMKNLIFTAFTLIAALAISATGTVSGQVKSVAAANNQSGSKPATPAQNPANATRARVLGQNPKVSVPDSSAAIDDTLQAKAKPDFNNHTEAGRFRRTGVISDKASPNVIPDSSRAGAINLQPLASSANVSPSNSVNSSPIATVSSQLYRVGVHDVLDIQLADNSSMSSTLFTVLDGGLLEYPLAGNPIAVAGLTPPEIAALLRQRIKIFDNPTVVVNVRDYASHAVTVTGFVAAPGVKTLRREAVPLYALLAEASVLPEAARATITRQGRQPIIVDLKDSNLSSTLVVPGDSVKVSGMPAGPTEFFFIGGEINAPGQQSYHAGLTLTQAILASGGTKTSAGSKVRVSRQGADGRLMAEEYNLRKIQSGKTPDPVVQKGDRIEVGSVN